MPGLQTRSPVGGMSEATTHLCFSPSPSLLLSLKINWEEISIDLRISGLKWEKSGSLMFRAKNLTYVQFRVKERFGDMSAFRLKPNTT